MITIFNGRQISLNGAEDQIWAQVSVALRDVLYCFNTGKSLNPFGVFMAIALHANADGWAWPGRARLSKETGIKSAISVSIKHLCKMRIEGHRVLAAWRERRNDGTWGRTLYRIFPDAFEDIVFPDDFDAEKMHQWDPNQPNTDQPGVDDLGVDNPGVDNQHMKYIQSQEEPEEKNNRATALPPSGKKEQDGIFEYQMVDESDEQFACECGVVHVIWDLPKTRASCKCGNGLRVRDVQGKVFVKPMIKPVTIGDLIPDIEGVFRAWRVNRGQRQPLLEAHQYNPGMLLECLDWGRRKVKDGDVKMGTALGMALNWAKKRMREQEVIERPPKPEPVTDHTLDPADWEGYSLEYKPDKAHQQAIRAFRKTTQ